MNFELSFKRKDLIFVFMIRRLHLLFKYLQYCFSSFTRHDVHSPFVYRLIEEVLHDNRIYYSFESIEFLRRQLLHDPRQIRVTDFGAGSLLGNQQEKPLALVARSAAKPKKYGQLLFRLAHYFQPVTILELGTSLGLSTAYLSSARPQAQVYTLEGCPVTAKLAEEHFQRLHLQNIQIRVGHFDETLSPVLARLPRLDLVFFDGNHRKEPTLRYFEQALSKAHNDSLFIFDDIHWTREMEGAWQAIQAHTRVMLTIDLFFIGLVFFKSEFKVKQHFVIKY